MPAKTQKRPRLPLPTSDGVRSRLENPSPTLTCLLLRAMALLAGGPALECALSFIDLRCRVALAAVSCMALRALQDAGIPLYKRPAVLRSKTVCSAIVNGKSSDLLRALDDAGILSRLGLDIQVDSIINRNSRNDGAVCWWVLREDSSSISAGFVEPQYV